MRKTIALLTILLLTACGGSDGPTSPVTPEPPPEEPEPPVEPEPEPEPVPIVVSLAMDSARFDAGECEYDMVFTAEGDSAATWTGMDVVWYHDGAAIDGEYTQEWVADWLGATLTAVDTVYTGLITMPDSLRFELHYQRVDSSTASVGGFLPCPRT